MNIVNHSNIVGRYLKGRLRKKLSRANRLELQKDKK